MRWVSGLFPAFIPADDQFKADNRGLLLAYWSVRVYADGVDTSEQRLRQNAELLQGNADPVVLLAHHCQRWGDNARAQTLITWARTLEPTRTDLEFYELVFAFYCAAAAQDVSELHSASAKLDRYITSHTLDSEFQVLTTAKVTARSWRHTLVAGVCRTGQPGTRPGHHGQVQGRA